MPRFYKTRQIVKRDKHEITWSNLAQNASTNQAIALSLGVSVGDKDTSTECAVGSHIRGIYLEFHFSAQVTTNPKVIHWKVVVIRSGQTMEVANSYYQPTRSQVIKRGMEMLPSDQSTVFKRIVFVSIPKAYQRVKEGSSIRFDYQASSAETINACGFAIYKEIY